MINASEWREEDLERLVQDGITEDVSLEYKRCASLKKDEPHKDEIGRDVSSFANSAGGTIVYGIEENENNHLPKGLDDGFQPSEIDNEWLENVIHSRIKPKINGLHINAVQLSGRRAGKVAYVVTIPQGITAHQAADKKYYKRYNFKREAMEHYEIVDVMNRLKSPLILPSFSKVGGGKRQEGYSYLLYVSLKNTGSISARDLKLILSIPAALSTAVGGGFVQEGIEVEGSHFGKNWFKNSLTTREQVIFPDDEWIVTSDSSYRFEYAINTNRFDLNDSTHPFLLWKIYADDMTPQSGEVLLSQVRLKSD